MILGLVIMTIGVYGVIRFPDVYTRLHAASKAVFLGVISLLISTSIGSEPEVYLRTVLISVFLLLTTPVSAHAIARAAYVRRSSMQTPGATDESNVLSGREPETGD